MFWTFSDITTDPAANEAACAFIRRKIGSTVHDAEKARKLTPHDYYARRPLCDAGYYERFNQDNVDIVALKETPITCLTESGIQTSDGKVHELDVVIFATGFDAVDGNYTRVRIKGRGGRTLKDHWSEKGPTSYLGVSVPGFPNMFMLTGPNGPFTNIPPTLETHVEFVSDTIKRAEEHRKGQNGHAEGNQAGVVEATQEAENEWTDLCDEMCKDSLFRKTDSWIFGANVPGKKRSTYFFFGGLKEYRRRMNEIVEEGYKGFKPF